MRSKADETFVIVDILICSLQVLILVLRVEMRFMKLYYFSTHHLFGVEIMLIGVELLVIPTSSFRRLQKTLLLSLFT